MPPSDDGALPYRLTRNCEETGIYLHSWSRWCAKLSSPAPSGLVSYRRMVAAPSGAATPQRAIASCDEWQAVFIARPVGVVRQLELLLNRLPALTFLRLFLDLGRGLLHQCQDILGVLLGAERSEEHTSEL